MAVNKVLKKKLFKAGLVGLAIYGGSTFLEVQDFPLRYHDSPMLEHKLKRIEREAGKQRYAVLVGGSKDLTVMHTLNHFYDTLIDHGFEKDKIFTMDYTRYAASPFPVNDISTYGNIEKTLERLSEVVDDDDEIIFYGVGHGHLEYIVAGDSVLALPGFDLESEDLKDMMDKIKAEKKMVMVESCQAGNFSEDFDDTHYIAISTSGKYTNAVTFSDEEETVTKNFTTFFLEAFYDGRVDANGDGRVNIPEAFDWAKKEQNAYIKLTDEKNNTFLGEQFPQYNNSIDGDAFFLDIEDDE